MARQRDYTYLPPATIATMLAEALAAQAATLTTGEQISRNGISYKRIDPVANAQLIEDLQFAQAYQNGRLRRTARAAFNMDGSNYR